MVMTIVAAIDNHKLRTKFVAPVFMTRKNEMESNIK
jgi:hypothetical protein